MNTNITIRYKKRFHVDLRDVDFMKQLKLSSLFSYFQEVASEAADSLGFGIDRLQKEFNVAWVLVRMRVEIIRNPNWNETITIETWPLEPNRLEFHRDFLVYDERGNILIRAISDWVIMDIDQRKLKRSEHIGIVYPEMIKERAIDKKLSRLKDFGNLQESYKKVIGYSDIDINGHLNNSNYVDYIMDCFPVEEHKKYKTKAIEVHFLHELLPGETLTLRRDVSAFNSHLVYIDGVNGREQTVFKAQLEIENR
ncbi:acyl-[acyl-carrier-protein] thioesterase [Fervidibacillus halotolerans]|uniref:Thioesterase n=1 Tax=Fervidibacillus halotolerans TaxID=2980027 RepID=A0A9E8RZ46_9BACI|nr:acyl-ACP thioesterase domain-containing protein [Fervidibacillus halotolerans]WAA13531.1 thioesterase [Fervidibacillus halotolerans]